MTVKAISQNRDIESYKAKLSKTDVQKKRVDSIKEGFLINNFVKDTVNNNLIDIEGNFIIPNKKNIDSKFDDNKSGLQKKISKISSNPLTPLCLTAIGVLGGIAAVSKILSVATKLNLKASKFERLPDLPRNMNLYSENDFVTYMAIQNPNIKTILGAFATISFAGAVFVIKNFVDGLKEIWVKKQEAGIQRNLQEALIEVETKSFAGKNNIIRNLMREKADEMKNLSEYSLNKNIIIPPVFEGFVSFKGKDINLKENNNKNQNNNNTLLYSLIGIGTVGLCVLLAKKTISNIKSIGTEMSKYNSKMHENIDKILTSATPEKLKADKSNLLDIFSVLHFKPEYVKEKLTKAGVEKEEIEQFISGLEKKYRVFVNAPEALGGKQGIQYYSYIDDVQGHLYNWIMNHNNGNVGKFTKNLFIALTTVAGFTYWGKTVVEAIKEVQVKKFNAQTDLDLHKKLVDVELRNFEAKKRSNIDILMNEFNKLSRTKQDKEKLQTMATEILYEIKNGAPFVYS